MKKPLTPFVPIPSLAILVHALFAKPSRGKHWLNSYPGHSIQFYSRGSFGLAAAVNFILDKKNKNSGIVWLPDYFCNEALVPMRNMNVSICYYSIKENLEPNWDDIERELKDIKAPDAFLIVHYFGFPNNIEKAITLCKKYNIELIEDMAHLLTGTVGAGNSFKIFSPRKLLALPEGGLLLSPGQHSLSYNIAKTGNINIFKWILVKLIQKILIGVGVSWHEFSRRRAENRNKRQHPTKYNVADRIPNNYSMKLLSLTEEEISRVYEKRKRNYGWLCKSVKKMDNVNPLFLDIPHGTCPYVFPLVVHEKGDELYNELRLKGIPVSTWPDLPPEVEESKEQHKNAIWLRDHILLLPVHQDLDEKQLDYMAQTLMEICSRKATHG